VVSEPALQTGQGRPEAAGAVPVTSQLPAARQTRQEMAAPVPPDQHNSLPAQADDAAPGAEPGGRAIGRHRAGPASSSSTSGSRIAGAVLLGLGGGCLASWALGIFLVAWNNHLGDVNPGYNYAPGEAWGAFFILAPFIAGAVWVLVQVAEIAAAEHRRYREWKASLTPQQRMAVELSETAALTAAAVAWHKHNKQVDTRLTSSVMGWTMPDGVTPRPSQRAALRHQQQPYVRQAQHAAQAPQAARMTEQLSHRWRPPGQG
jgi:hypothetical protein